MDAPTDIAIVEQVTAQGIPKPRLWLSVLQRRRWETFKANRRGFWSLWIFLVLFAISLFAEFIANDKPILVSYQGQLYMPIFKAYPETTFGGIFETEADYREFVTTVIYHPHLERLPSAELRNEFIDRVTELAANETPPFTLDYWRLNISAAKP